MATEAKLVYVQPHMHLRGKDYELRLIYPTGESQVVFKGKVRFQLAAWLLPDQPILMPKGTCMVGISHFDNPPNNKFPIPTPARRFVGVCRIGMR